MTTIGERVAEKCQGSSFAHGANLASLIDAEVARAADTTELVKACSDALIRETNRAMKQAYQCGVSGESTAAYGKWDTCFGALIRPLISAHVAARLQEQSDLIAKLTFMVENGLGPDDMKDDITWPRD